jgi:hypothetical protein
MSRGWSHYEPARLDLTGAAPLAGAPGRKSLTLLAACMSCCSLRGHSGLRVRELEVEGMLMIAGTISTPGLEVLPVDVRRQSITVKLLRDSSPHTVLHHCFSLRIDVPEGTIASRSPQSTGEFDKEARNVLPAGVTRNFAPTVATAAEITAGSPNRCLNTNTTAARHSSSRSLIAYETWRRDARNRLLSVSQRFLRMRNDFATELPCLLCHRVVCCAYTPFLRLLLV